MGSIECKHPTCSGSHCRRTKPEKKVYTLKRTPIKKKPYTIKKVGEKRAGRLVLYKGLRALFMKNHKVCEAELDGCTKVSTDIHHLKGRENDLLNQTAYWMAVCRSCHQKITDDSKMAIEKGLSISRHKKINNENQ